MHCWRSILLLMSLSLNCLCYSSTSNGTWKKRQLFIASCPVSESVPLSDNHYFHLRELGSSSLVICEHPSATHYLPSGFALVYSTSRLHSQQMTEKRISSILDVNPHATQIVTDFNSQTMAPFITVRAPIDEIQIINDSRASMNNLFSTATHSILSSSSTIMSTNLSLSDTFSSIADGNKQKFHMLIIVASISAMVLLLTIIIYALFKCHNRDEGSYKIKETHNFVNLPQFETLDCGNNPSASTPNRQKFILSKEHKLADSREWFV